MRNIILTIALLFMATVLTAQSVDLDRFRVDHKFRQLPNMVLDKSFKTYSVQVKKSTTINQIYTEPVSDKINIEGKMKVEKGGHLRVTFQLEDLLIESTEVSQRVEVHKDKDGKETGRTNYYKVNAIYTFKSDAEVIDFQEKKLRSYSFESRSSKKTHSTQEFSKSSEAVEYYNNNRNLIRDKLATDQVNSCIDALNRYLNADFGYQSTTENDILWVLGSKKHAEFAPYTEACNTVKSALETIDADRIPEDITEQMKSAIQYFESLPKKYSDPKDRNQKKLRYGAYFNLAKIYFFIEQFDKATEYANLLTANDYDPKDGKKITDEIQSLKETFQKHGINTRHFIPDLEDAVAPN